MRKFLILAYHRILPEEVAVMRGALAVSTSNFENQIKFFINRGWRSLTLSEFYTEFVKTGKKPRKVFIVTFDDGYQDNYLYAFPILKKYSIRATIFLVANSLESSTDLYFATIPKPYAVSEIDYALTREQIQEMLDYGIEFGSHTMTHAKLNELNASEASWEIEHSKKSLEQYLNREITSFCYPYGLLNEDIVSIVNRAGYRIAVITPPCPKIPNTIMTMHRTGVYLTDTIVKFRMKCTSLFYFFRTLKIFRAIHRK